jgi:hypothetical protein
VVIEKLRFSGFFSLSLNFTAYAPNSLLIGDELTVNESFSVLTHEYWSWSGKLGADAVATVGLTESVMTSVYTVGLGLAAGLLSLTIDYGPRGLFYAIVIAYCLFAIVSSVLFQRGKWKNKVV